MWSRGSQIAGMGIVRRSAARENSWTILLWRVPFNFPLRMSRSDAADLLARSSSKAGRLLPRRRIRLPRPTIRRHTPRCWQFAQPARNSASSNCTVAIFILPASPVPCAWERSIGRGWRTFFFPNAERDAPRINFDDSFIYCEIARPQKQRAIPMTQMMREQALAGFRAWQEKSDKIVY